MRRVFLLFCILYAYNSLYAGELYIRFNQNSASGYKFDLELSANSYVWGWNISKNETYPLKDQSFTYLKRTSVIFSAPKAVGSAPERIFWGVFDVTLKLYKYNLDDNGNVTYMYIRPFYFKLNLLDEQWSFSNPPYIGIDTYVEFMIVEPGQNGEGGSYILNLVADHNGYYKKEEDIGNAEYKIWELWSVTTPLQSNFTYPVQLMNREEGGNAGFGYLVSGNKNVASDNFDNFKKDVTNSVIHGTTEINNEGRKYSFQWENIQIEQTLSNIYNSKNDFKITNGDVKDRQIIRYFKNVYPLTVKNYLPEVGSQSYGSVMFKDPTTTNAFEEKAAAGSGFVKNETFAGFDETVNGQLHQKYSLQAKPSIAYNGKIYNWYAGDFNPNTQTDMLITAPTTKSAYYKGSFLSNNPNAFSSSGQRKIAKADYNDNWVHMVYESMGKIWYKYSDDNGVTWVNEKLVGEGSNPSIDVYKDYNPSVQKAVIVYQWDEDDYSSELAMVEYHNGIFNKHESVYFPIYPDGSNPHYKYVPVVSAGWSYRLVFWRPANSSGLYYRYMNKNSNNEWIWGNETLLPGTNASSLNYSIATDPAYTDNGYIVYQQNINSYSSSIHLKQFFTNPALSFQNTITIAPNSEGGYNYLNHHPSVIVSGNRMPYVSWIQYSPMTYMNSALLKYQTGSSNWSPVYCYGGSAGNYEADVLSLHLASIGNVTVPTFALAFSDAEGSNNMYVKGSDLNSIYYSNTSGSYLQVMGGATASAAKIVSYYNTALPYYFQFSNGLSGLAKTEETAETLNDRVLQAVSGSAVVNFGIGDISLNGSQVKFETANDSLEAIALNQLENFIVSEEFAVDKSSVLTYKLIMGISNYDSALTAKMPETENLKLSAELIDAKTGKVLITLNKLDYNKSAGEKTYGGNYYKVENIGFDGSVKLRITALNNLNDKETEISLKKYAYLNKKKLDKVYEKIDAGETEKVVSYALSQNYPNPFNPSTIINYDIPEASQVSLKVYDILGREVVTLVDEFKEAGRYNVIFNASKLATGVYIYQIRANDYVSVKKMSFVK